MESQKQFSIKVGGGVEEEAHPVLKQLHDLILACLHPISKSLNLNCSVLLYGQRGSGKAELVRRVSDDLGVHVLEVKTFKA